MLNFKNRHNNSHRRSFNPSIDIYLLLSSSLNIKTVISFCLIKTWITNCHRLKSSYLIALLKENDKLYFKLMPDQKFHLISFSLPKIINNTRQNICKLIEIHSVINNAESLSEISGCFYLQLLTHELTFGFFRLLLAIDHSDLPLNQLLRTC